MMLGKNDRDVAHLSGLGETVKKIAILLHVKSSKTPRPRSTLVFYLESSDRGPQS